MTEKVGREIAEIAAARTLTEFEAVLEELELPPQQRKAMMRRLGKKTKTNIPSEINTKYLISELEKKAALALSYIDDHSLATAPAHSIAQVLAVLVDRRQLLRGEPTQIASVEDRRNMNEIMPLLLKEAERRGMTIDLPSEDYAVLGEQVTIRDSNPKPKLVRD